MLRLFAFLLVLLTAMLNIGLTILASENVAESKLYVFAFLAALVVLVPPISLLLVDKYYEGDYEPFI